MNKINKDVNRVEVSYEKGEDGMLPHVLNICGEDLMKPGAKMCIQTIDVHFAPDELPSVKLTMCPEIVELKLGNTNTLVQIGPFLFTPEAYKKEILPLLHKHCWNSAKEEEEYAIANVTGNEPVNEPVNEEEYRVFPAEDTCACCGRETACKQLLSVRAKEGVEKKAYCPFCLEALIEETQKPNGKCYIGKYGELRWRKE